MTMAIKRFARAWMLAAAIAAAGFIIVAGLCGQASAASSSEAMHRLYNPNSGEHFYTSSTIERDHLTSIGWQSEGEGWTAPTSGDAVYRLYNSVAGEHHYTLSAAERDMLVGVGWNDEGIGWYSDPSKGVPLYRVYNPNEYANNHHYTTSAVERDYLLGLGWQDEGISWYGVSPDAAANPTNPSNPSGPSGSVPGEPGSTPGAPTPDNPDSATNPNPKVYTVTLDANGGALDGTTNLSVTKGSSIGNYPVAWRSGYEFVGWFSGPTGGFQYTSTTPINNDVTLYALWEVSSSNPPKTNYRVAFYANGGTGTMNVLNYYHDTTYNLPRCLFKRDGYEFEGWATSATGAVVYADKAAVRNLAPGGGTYELYARWKEK